MITFEGFSWTNGEPKNLPVKTVAAKILCTTHNSSLTHLDALAQRFFETGAKFHNNQSDRAKLKRSAIWKVDRAEFNGFDFERLLAKIAVGLVQSQADAKWHLGDSIAMEPPLLVLEAIYGLREFPRPMGLYYVGAVGDTIVNEDRVTIHTMFHPQTSRFLGAIISIRHMQFFINLSDIEPAEYSMHSVTEKVIGLNGSEPQYRIRTMNFNANAKISGQINLNW